MPPLIVHLTRILISSHHKSPDNNNRLPRLRPPSVQSRAQLESCPLIIIRSTPPKEQTGRTECDIMYHRMLSDLIHAASYCATLAFHSFIHWDQLEGTGPAGQQKRDGDGYIFWFLIRHKKSPIDLTLGQYFSYAMERFLQRQFNTEEFTPWSWLIDLSPSSRMHY